MTRSCSLLDAAGRGRSPATLPGYLAGCAPKNKGMRYPPDPPRPEEIVLVMRRAGNDRHGLRIRALIAGALAWRAADLRSARVGRDRRRPTAWFAADPARKRRQAP